MMNSPKTDQSSVYGVKLINIDSSVSIKDFRKTVKTFSQGLKVFRKSRCPRPVAVAPQRWCTVGGPGLCVELMGKFV